MGEEVMSGNQDGRGDPGGGEKGKGCETHNVGVIPLRNLLEGIHVQCNIHVTCFHLQLDRQGSIMRYTTVLLPKKEVYMRPWLKSLPCSLGMLSRFFGVHQEDVVVLERLEREEPEGFRGTKDFYLVSGPDSFEVELRNYEFHIGYKKEET